MTRWLAAGRPCRAGVTEEDWLPGPSLPELAPPDEACAVQPDRNTTRHSRLVIERRSPGRRASRLRDRDCKARRVNASG